MNIVQVRVFAAPSTGAPEVTMGEGRFSGPTHEAINLAALKRFGDRSKLREGYQIGLEGNWIARDRYIAGKWDCPVHDYEGCTITTPVRLCYDALEDRMLSIDVPTPLGGWRPLPEAAWGRVRQRFEYVPPNLLNAPSQYPRLSSSDELPDWLASDDNTDRAVPVRPR